MPDSASGHRRGTPIAVSRKGGERHTCKDPSGGDAERWRGTGAQQDERGPGCAVPHPHPAATWASTRHLTAVREAPGALWPGEGADPQSASCSGSHSNHECDPGAPSQHALGLPTEWVTLNARGPLADRCCVRPQGGHHGDLPHTRPQSLHPIPALVQDPRVLVCSYCRPSWPLQRAPGTIPCATSSASPGGVGANLSARPSSLPEVSEGESP